MVDERYVEPDYFVDRPPDAIYVPPDMGSDKATHMDERNDPDLVDFWAPLHGTQHQPRHKLGQKLRLQCMRLQRSTQSCSCCPRTHR